DMAVKDGVIFVRAEPHRRVSYAELIGEKEFSLKLDPAAPLKNPKDYTIVGQPLPRPDIPGKVTGIHTYMQDFRVPGMLHARVVRPPAIGATLQSVDESSVQGVKGARVVRQGSFLAVVAESEWGAVKAARALKATWSAWQGLPEPSKLWEHVRGTKIAKDDVAVDRGDPKAAIAGAAKKVEAVYAYPFQNHAPMEPMNATAKYTPDRCEVWVPTQNGEAAFAATLAASGLPADKCEVYKINLGGGFGRRGAFHDYVTQAVLIAKQIPGTPVKLLWSREEDMQHGHYHPIMMAKLTGGLDANNNLVALHVRLSGQSILAAVRPHIVEQQKGRDPLTFQGLADTGEHAFGYSIPNLLIDHAMRNTHVPPGFWRGVNINQNAVFMECFMDELAQAAGQDEVEFRRKNMAGLPRNLAALNAVAERIGWGKPAKQGVYRGLAQMKAFNSFVAAAAEISVRDGNKVKIHRIVAATDPGYAVNPAQIERQVSGSFVYGLSGLFMQECTVKDGAIQQTNFHDYPSMKIAQMPKVETIILQPGGAVWGGIGEPTICVAAPAVLNAIAKATGKRLRNVPIKHDGFEMV
ncbi:MAG: xanthine dehydrogenase family protein molybdopterin-binding subunit, partial [Burkholderiales bacterium]